MQYSTQKCSIHSHIFLTQKGVGWFNFRVVLVTSDWTKVAKFVVTERGDFGAKQVYFCICTLLHNYREMFLNKLILLTIRARLGMFRRFFIEKERCFCHAYLQYKVTILLHHWYSNGNRTVMPRIYYLDKVLVFTVLQQDFISVTACTIQLQMCLKDGLMILNITVRGFRDAN